MKRRFLFTLLSSFAFCVLMYSCGGTSSSNDVDADIVTNNKSANDPDADNKEPILTCDEPIWEFGKINEGEVVLHSFSFTNTGNEDLVIIKCLASCGCTTMKCDTKPVAPGGRGEIKIRFDSKNKKKSQTKNITITANTIPPKTILTIHGYVIPSSE